MKGHAKLLFNQFSSKLQILQWLLQNYFLEFYHNMLILTQCLYDFFASQMNSANSSQ